jgi:hypothetical protein
MNDAEALAQAMAHDYGPPLGTPNHAEFVYNGALAGFVLSYFGAVNHAIATKPGVSSVVIMRAMHALAGPRSTPALRTLYKWRDDCHARFSATAGAQPLAQAARYPTINREVYTEDGAMCCGATMVPTFQRPSVLWCKQCGHKVAKSASDEWARECLRNKQEQNARRLAEAEAKAAVDRDRPHGLGVSLAVDRDRPVAGLWVGDGQAMVYGGRPTKKIGVPARQWWRL